MPLTDLDSPRRNWTQSRWLPIARWFLSVLILSTVGAGCNQGEKLAPRATPLASAETDCNANAGGRTLVIATAGQSNAANHGEAVTAPRRLALAYYGGKCYRANDPQPGASGNGGSPWPALADQFIERGYARRVLYAHCAITSTTVAMWNQNPELIGCLDDARAGLKRHGLKIDFVLWHQGEADARAGTETEPFRAALVHVISKIKTASDNAPILLAQTSVCRSLPNAAIRSVQASFWDASHGIYAGPDTDRLGATERYDGCHFSRAGLLIVANMWAQAITNTGKLSGN